MALTPTLKQEAFASAYVSNGGHASDAYREAYNVENMGDKSINVEASRLLDNPIVALRIQELQNDLKERQLWSRVDSVETLKNIAQGLLDDAKPSDRVAAVKAINQMMGWDKQVVDNTSSDGSMTPKPISINIKPVSAKKGE